MNLFAYGTLMWTEVLDAVVGCRLHGEPAVVEGFRRLRLAGEHYPAVLPAPGGRVEGILYRGLSESDFRALDAFEGEEYDRIEIQLGEIAAWLYVLAPAWRHRAVDLPWNPADLTPGQLAEFCSVYKGWGALER